MGINAGTDKRPAIDDIYCLWYIYMQLGLPWLEIDGGRHPATTLKPEEPLQPRNWTDGKLVRLDITEKRIEITAVSLESGQRIPRGHYRFCGE